MAKKEKKLNVKDVAKKQVVEDVKAHYEVCRRKISRQGYKYK